MDSRQFFAELKRRNVYKVAVGYPVAAWLAAEIYISVFPVLDFDKWMLKFVLDLVVSKIGNARNLRSQTQSVNDAARADEEGRHTRERNGDAGET